MDETGRNRDVRMKEHQTDIRKHESSLALTKHTETEKHTFDCVRHIEKPTGRQES